MASLLAVGGICSSFGGSFSSSVLQPSSASDEGLNGRVPPSPSAAQQLLSGEFSPAAPDTETFGADTSQRSSYPLGKREGLRGCGTPRVVRIVRLTRTILIEEEQPVLTPFRESTNFAEKSPHETHGVRTMKLTELNEDGIMAQGSRLDSPRRRFLSAKELPVVSAFRHGNTHIPKGSSTSEAIAILKHRQQQGLSIDSYMLVDILKRCSTQKDLTATREVHNYIYQSGMQRHLYVANTLLSVYVKCDRLQDARRVFDGLESTDRDIITWNSMIGGYARNGNGVEASRLFVQMDQEGFVADALTYANILNPAASAGALEWVREVHHHAHKRGLESNLRVGNALVNMFAKSGSINDARLVFDKMEERDVVTWNIMIGAYAKAGCGMEAYKLFLQMESEGLIADAFTYASILNPSASAGALNWVREVHHHARKAGLESDLRVGSGLVHMYAKSGSINDARLVFDSMEARDVITWNIMIGAYAESGCGVEAYRLFLQMNREGCAPTAFTYASILNPSAGAGALEWVRDIHAHARKGGLESNLRVGSGLVQMYAKTGCIDAARLVFDRIQKRDVIAWNIMIGAYAEIGSSMEAYRLFLQMNREACTPNAFTYASILSPSASPGASEWVKEVHAHARKAGLDSNLHVGNALVHMYARNGGIDEARLVFDSMEERNVITWNIMIGAYAESGCGMESYQLFLQMKKERLVADEFTYVSILHPSASAGALEWVTEVHRHAREEGLESNLRVGNAFVHMYAKSGSIDAARRVFDSMPERDVITWNIMIGAYAKGGFGTEAYRLFLGMKSAGLVADEFTYAGILNPAASAGAVEWVKEVHSHARKGGLDSNLRVGSGLVHMYAKTGSVDDARLVFDRMQERDVITWNIMIGAYAEGGWGMEAYRLFLQMNREGCTPNVFTYTSILNPSASAGALEWVKEVHGHALRGGLESNLRVGSGLVHMYSKSGSIDDARLVFDRMEERDIITWNIMIGAYAESGFGMKAYGLFLQMEKEGIKADAFTYASILNPCASAGPSEWVREVHAHAREAGLESNLRVGSGLVHMYAKKGNINDARQVFDRMEERDLFTWTAMIGGLAQHGCGDEALEIFKSMNADSVKPDGTTFVAVLSACSHAGLVDDGRRLFLAMKQDYGVEAKAVHYNCMVDLLGRAGQLEEAKLLIDKMPVEPEPRTWRSLLGACRTYCNVELGELAATEALKLEPKNAGVYVLLSNIYAAAGKWEKVGLVRTMMEERGVRKEPGRSWIEVDNKIHEFVVGDTFHPEAKAIYSVLQELTEKLKAKGYIPDTTVVLQNIHEEDKELALCSHSEKLAIAYGLLRLPRGTSIHVHKNLRVCLDCHAATKLISEVTRREIIVRDANRFHHFKDGVCSCGDYW